MEKNMATTSTNEQVVTVQPPSYNETVNPLSPSTAHAAPEGDTPPPHPQKENEPPQLPPTISVQTMHPLEPKPCQVVNTKPGLVCPNCQQPLDLTKIHTRSTKKAILLSLTFCTMGVCCCWGCQ